MPIVCVTGATGFIAGHIIEQLLAAGHTVRGTARKLEGKDIDALRVLPGASERLSIVKADLLERGSYDAAVHGCDYVLHTASPYTLDAKDPARDLVEPAVEGTGNVLLSAQRSTSVKRVVVTSSMAAITDEPESDHVLSEKDWNTKSSVDRNPYYYSKAMAERRAWSFVEEHRPSFDLVVINPFMVIGPSITPSLNTSNQMFVDMLGGVYPGIMNLTWGFVDVRDVARAHLLAIEKGGAKGRYLCANATKSMRELVELMSKHGWTEGRKAPKVGLDCAVGDFVVRLSSYTQPKGVGTYLRTHVGRVPRFDNTKIREELGLEMRPIEQTILDTLEDLSRWGHLKPAA
jgi:dihydroflavonol-4-reductase